MKRCLSNSISGKKSLPAVRVAICLLASILLIGGSVPPVFAEAELSTGATKVAPKNITAIKGTTVARIMKETGAWLQRTVTDPMISTVGGEWTIIGLARSGLDIPQTYFDTYYRNVESEMKDKQGKLTSVKYTEYSRLILALTAMGRDVKNVGGYNLLERTADYNQVIKQGVNGSIFALIALDSYGYAVPAVPGVELTTRQKLIDYILSREITDGNGVKGGFALTGQTPDPDLTGMTLQALAGYRDQPAVSSAIDRALSVISAQQQANGGFLRFGSEDSETLAQMITGLCALGINPDTDPRFVKKDADGKKNSLIDALLAFQTSGGGFAHKKGGTSDLMAAEQAMYALTAYNRYLQGKTALYHMSDVSIDRIRVLLNGEELPFDQPPVNIDGRVLVPLRVIFEAMGAHVAWDPVPGTVTAKQEDRTVILTIGAKTAYVDGKPVLLDVAGRIINGRTLLPVRFIAESLDAEVRWVPETRTVEIVK